MNRKKTILVLLLCLCFLCGCGLVSKSSDKIKDLEFTVVSEERLSNELKNIVEERKAQPFKVSYHDKEYLYLCVGYGEQKTGGYSIIVEELYLTEDAIHADTSLMGPGPEDDTGNAPSYPYIVIKTPYMDKTVIFD